MAGWMRSQVPLLVAMAVTLAVASLAVLLLSGFPFALVSVPLDVLVNDTALLVAIAVIWLALLRFRGRGDPASGAVAAAFLVSAGLNLLVITAQASGLDGELGMTLTNPTQEPLFLHGAARLIMAGTLLMGGLAVSGRWTPPSRGWWIAVPLGVAAVAALGLHLLSGSLPAWVGPGGISQLAGQRTGEPLQGLTGIAYVIQAASALSFLSAAILYARWRPEPRSAFPAFLAVALVLGAVSEVQFLVYPGSFTGLVGSNDVVRLVFATVMVLGIAADLRASSRALVRAEAEVQRLRDAELAGVALAERARLAREIHDGLSQHLWLAKLRLEEMRGIDVPPPVMVRVEEVAALVDTGLQEAQQTIAALRDSGRDQPLLATLRSYAETFSAQRGIRVDIELDEAIGDVPPRVGAELLRVIQEAFANVVRHADATRISLRLQHSGGRLELAVEDNGIGFDPDQQQGGFGLTSMQERVAGIGGELEVRSAASEGTSVLVRVPLDA